MWAEIASECRAPADELAVEAISEQYAAKRSIDLIQIFSDPARCDAADVELFGAA